MDQLTEIRRPIEAEMRAYQNLFKETLTTDNPLLQLALNHLMQRWGKMMRPMLVVLAARYGGQGNSRAENVDGVQVPEEVLHAAVALELLHTASLVHDDVVDESDRRRGQKSINALLDNQAAVLVGDFLLSKALYHSARTGSNRVVTWVAELGQQLADGELLQLANLDKTTISEEDCFEVIGKKTASLFETCAKVGVLLAGGNEEDIRLMADFGRHTGLCFQLRDDLFDYDNQHDTGKPSGNDMREGKLTLPVVHALLLSQDEAMWDVALKVRRGEASDEEIGHLVRFTYDVGGIEYALKALDKMGEDCLALLNGEGRDTAITKALAQYVRFVVGRNI